MSPIIYSRSTQYVIDFFIVAGAFLLAYILRYEGMPPLYQMKYLIFQLPYVVLLTLLSYMLTGLFKYSWRFISLREIREFLLAHFYVAVVLIIGRYGTPGDYPFLKVPISVIIINFFLVFLCSVGIRALHRVHMEMIERKSRKHTSDLGSIKRVLLIGAGNAGNIVARELHERVDLRMKPIGFVDDDPVKRGQVIQGLKVLGSIEMIPSLVGPLKIDALIICLVSVPGIQMRRIKSICDDTKLPLKILPGIYELIDGSVSVNRLREISIEDLLGRDEVHLDEERIRSFLCGKKVMITGAAGSIGSEMSRQVLKYQPKSVLLYEKAETPLFFMANELSSNIHNVGYEPVIGDICDESRLSKVFSDYRPQVVIHAAAYKHVPMMESNWAEAVKNNVSGTMKLADISMEHGVERFIMISTDKAVNPTSVMGSSKRIAEMYLQSLSRFSNTVFITVRFGNVLGSSGSAIPIFKEQLKKGGPITITHPDMKRYFMTIPEASQLVLQAATMGSGGEVFVLDMGNPVKMVDIARELIKLSGFKENEIEIIFTGTRPGEKLFEEISLSSEGFGKTLHPKIFTGKLAPVDYDEIRTKIDDLLKNVDSASKDEIVNRLVSIVPEYKPDIITGNARSK